MKIIRYACTHCGRKFEAEEKEVLECPGCFWSTSVKREEDVLEESQKKSVSASGSKPSFSLKFPSLPWKGIVAAILLLGGLFLFIKAGVPLLRKLSERSQDSLQISFTEKKQKDSQQTGLGTGNPLILPEGTALSPEDLNILSRRVQVNLERIASEEEQKILSHRAAFKSGFSEKLPSQTWTLENFKDMIAQQEKFYQVPLPKSYKNKLLDLFESKYAAGSEAFKAGNLIQARDLWVEALAFPVYANNPEKHRGVILTMMRPFINDTLSKIGAINGASVEKGIRAKEQAAVAAYEQLFLLIDKKDWPQALASVGEFNRRLAEFSSPVSLAGEPEAYSAGIANVDRDIQYTLHGLLTVPPPALSDLEPLRMDLVRKKRVLEGLIVENMKAMQQKYDEGMDALARKDWAEADRIFKTVDLPADLYRDAQDKIQVLRKLLKGTAAAYAGGSSGKRS